MNRPSIPAEIERQVFVECGHCCAVCGEVFPLEKAHIIPWHKSKEHKLEDLICLCANCHSRADSQGWGEKTLREYKLRPWILRRKDEQLAQQTSRIRLTLDMDVKEFDSRYQRIFVYALAGFLEIPPESVQIRSVESGSVKVTVELPRDAAERLLHATARDEERLQRCLLPFGGLVKHPARERTTASGKRIPHRTVQARLNFWQLMESNPLAVGAAALALGVLTGLFIPSTRREDELMGETRDRLLEDLQEEGRDALAKGRQVASAVVDRIKEEARHQDLTAEGLSEKVRQVAREATDSVKREARNQDLTGISGSGGRVSEALGGSTGTGITTSSVSAVGTTSATSPRSESSLVREIEETELTKR